MFDVVDEATLAAPVAVVFHEFLTLGRSGAPWWRPHLRAEPVDGDPARVGGRMRIILPYGLHFVAELREVVPDRLIRRAYVDGAFKGEGLLSFDPVPAGTHVRYHWRARPGNLSCRLLALVTDLAKGHSQLMQHGFAGLATYLGAGQRAEPR